MIKYKICLTGGIASGKTYVSDQFSLFGACVIDADVLARQVVARGTKGLAEIVGHFGLEVLNQDNTLNREVLKKIVFSDKSKLKLLNEITHPLIKNAFENKSKLNKSELEIWVIPLLSEQSDFSGFNRILVIDVKEDIQFTRIINRDRVEQKIAKKIIQSQPAKNDRLKLATDVIVNNNSFESLDTSIRQIFDFYLQLKNQQSA